jgi:diketogulonate reductase-like aldo/keto reductase
MGMSEFYSPSQMNDRESIRVIHHYLDVGGNFARNLELVAKIGELAHRKGCTPGQLALAWVLAQGPDIVPIPGTKQIKYVDENLAATNVALTSAELREIDAVLPLGSAAGDRYHAQAMAAVNR